MNETVKVPDRPATANPVAIFRHELDGMNDQFKAALPAHIPVERFARVLMTAAQNNPDMIGKAERRSLWNAAMRAAQDGLLPDGREGAIVLYGAQAQWMPMIGGIRKKVRNSGEIATWDVYVVHANDEFEYELGDNPFIRHKPTLEDPGEVVAAYSVATLKTGEKSREVMSVAAIEKVRQASKAKNNGPWVGWYEEMCRKTVARRHSKVLPMSTDLDDLIRRDDDLYDFDGARRESEGDKPRSLASRLDALAAPPKTIEGSTEAADLKTAADVASESQDPQTAAPPPATTAPAPATAASSATATPAEKARLGQYHHLLEGALTSPKVGKISADFWKGELPAAGSALHAGMTAILGAHARRVAGETSIADVDNTVREWIA